MHFLHDHLVNFPENCGDISDEQSERFHQDIKEMEERYEDHYWSLKRDKQYQHRMRKSKKRSFSE